MAVRPIQSRLLGGKSTPAIRAILPPKPQRLKPPKNISRSPRLKPCPDENQLSLALAVLGIRTDHAHDAATMDDLALHANFLDRCSNFHFFDAFLTKHERSEQRPYKLLVPVDDPA